MRLHCQKWPVHAAADLAIIDTAGRHGLDEELVVELEQISDVANANERFLVIDAQVGQSVGQWRPISTTLQE